MVCCRIGRCLCEPAGFLLPEVSLLLKNKGINFILSCPQTVKFPKGFDNVWLERGDKNIATGEA